MSGKRKAPASSSGRARSTTTKTPRTWKQRGLWLLKWGLIAGVVMALVAVGGFYVAYRSIDIPDPNAEYLTATTHVYYDDGKTELGDFAIQRRDPISYDEMPQVMKDAVVAAEDQSFWTNKGIDPKGIIRAAFNDAKGGSTQGASTITQQYVKILYLTQERSWKRKVKEAILSLKIQQQLSKQEVLAGYLNTIYFGRGAYGIQAAAEAYFQVDAKDLDLKQAAVLAAVLNDPNDLDPDNGKAAKIALKGRYQYVLDSMADMGTADPDRVAKARKLLPDFPKQEPNDTYGGEKGHVLQMVKQELLDLGFSEEEIEGGGLKVTTTFTQKAMQAVEDGVMEQRPDGFSDKELHIGAATVEPGTGAVRGIFAGQDYLQSQLNWAVSGGQAGSTFKPFALAMALKNGWSLKDTFDGNSPFYAPDGTEFNNEQHNSYGSAVSLLKATEDSINTCYVDLTLSTPDGPQKIVDTAEDMGIPPLKTPNDPYGFPDHTPGLNANAQVALGSQTVSPINMANAYATIANGGVAAEPYIIEKVVDADGKVRYTHKVDTHRAITEDVAADVSYALQDVVKYGTGTAALALGRPAAGKTGTATNGLDQVSSAWFVGFTPQLSTAVMYVRGNGTGQLDGWLPEYFGGSYPARTWTAIMQTLMEGLPVEEFPPPANIDGEAPTEGHAPYTPPPPPTKKPSPTQQPTRTQSPSPSETSSAPPSSSATPSQTQPTLPTGPTSPTSSSGGGGQSTPPGAGQTKKSPRRGRRRAAA
ncbi:MAG TPA: transglycosylase domain-containing protein [Nocardioides sp.]|nr:transglycosylase domain-containing protein [Nocardioides sp.]